MPTETAYERANNAVVPFLMCPQGGFTKEDVLKMLEPYRYHEQILDYIADAAEWAFPKINEVKVNYDTIASRLQTIEMRMRMAKKMQGIIVISPADEAELQNAQKAYASLADDEKVGTYTALLGNIASALTHGTPDILTLAASSGLLPRVGFAAIAPLLSNKQYFYQEATNQEIIEFSAALLRHPLALNNDLDVVDLFKIYQFEPERVEQLLQTMHRAYEKAPQTTGSLTHYNYGLQSILRTVAEDGDPSVNIMDFVGMDPELLQKALQNPTLLKGVMLKEDIEAKIFGGIGADQAHYDQTDLAREIFDNIRAIRKSETHKAIALVEKKLQQHLPKESNKELYAHLGSYIEQPDDGWNIGDWMVRYEKWITATGADPERSWQGMGQLLTHLPADMLPLLMHRPSHFNEHGALPTIAPLGEVLHCFPPPHPRQEEYAQWHDDFRNHIIKATFIAPESYDALLGQIGTRCMALLASYEPDRLKVLLESQVDFLPERIALMFSHHNNEHTINKALFGTAPNPLAQLVKDLADETPQGATPPTMEEIIQLPMDLLKESLNAVVNKTQNAMRSNAQPIQDEQSKDWSYAPLLKKVLREIDSTRPKEQRIGLSIQ